MKVSVLTITYNQEAYVRAALESALAQEGTPDIEIVVGDDASTDRTVEIVESVQREHPGAIRLLRRPRNLGINRNFLETLSACEGDYIAVLDGDDYWTEPAKLRLQLELLESHPELSGCFHNATVIHEDGAPSHPFYTESPSNPRERLKPAGRSGVRELVSGNFILSSTVVLRRLPWRIPDWYYDAPLDDWPFFLFNVEQGPLAYIDEVMAAYRVHAGGAWSGHVSRYVTAHDCARMIGLYGHIDDHFRRAYHKEVQTSVVPLYRQAALRSAGERRIGGLLRYALRYGAHRGWREAAALGRQLVSTWRASRGREVRDS